jgi:hypothetical protein
VDPALLATAHIRLIKIFEYLTLDYSTHPPTTRPPVTKKKVYLIDNRHLLENIDKKYNQVSRLNYIFFFVFDALTKIGQSLYDSGKDFKPRLTLVCKAVI